MPQKKRSAIDVSKTLAQIYYLRPPFSTGPDGKPSSFRSGLIDRCDQLLVTPLRQFQPEDLRVMLSQEYYPETLVPLSLSLLEADPMLESEWFPGDLLSNTLNQKTEFWLSSPDLLTQIKGVLRRLDASGQTSELKDRLVIEALEHFKLRLSS